ncbi:SCA7-domain-containing protein [Gloeophyllum trabeum ATCC 11539]|uniref:SCA7-domain-containing protein n=1 Tax=Gloeophyllum trabeum (strain ATCC 11539 / FP-39264 / Madison 617) TaxID=670483 RepID=S7RPI9_GLOTA|nr:SCA7-domain-containing protein [Gloeophyllum trabeum ATCC 11539]EPQ56460.1 SCA7-domain-containing protein [Gloeophyllum trabeum ATCC 11539]
MALKLKPAPSPPTFSWDSPSESSSSDVASPPSPPTAWLSARDMKVFGSEPLKPEVGVVKCKDCGKPVLQSSAAEHADNCKRIQNEEAKKAGKGSTAELEESPKKGKKRKADEVDSPEDPNQPKKKKTTAKVTNRRFKGPVDYDKQCGVINDKGLPCSRSLTCKSHSMGAKRAVQGRSKPYDELLLEWNRANNPNWVEPVKKETKQERKEKKEREKAEKKRQALEQAAAAGIDITKKGALATGPKKGKKAAAAAAASSAVIVGDVDDIDENLDDIDSEAELDSLVRAVRTGYDKGVIGQPLALPYDAGSWFVARRERLRNCRDLLANALAPNARSSIAAGVAGARMG